MEALDSIDLPVEHQKNHQQRAECHHNPPGRPAQCGESCEKIDEICCQCERKRLTDGGHGKVYPPFGVHYPDSGGCVDVAEEDDGREQRLQRKVNESAPGEGAVAIVALEILQNMVLVF